MDSGLSERASNLGLTVLMASILLPFAAGSVYLTVLILRAIGAEVLEAFRGKAPEAPTPKPCVANDPREEWSWR